MTLEFQDVSLAFGEHRVVDHLSARYEFESVLALVGPSGGGKSTLLRLIAGLIVPDSGTIIVNGTPIPSERNALRRYRSSIGIVFQAYNLFPHLSALDNISLPLIHVHRTAAHEARSRSMDVLARFQLSEHALKRPAELSGGQRQRVAIARAIAIDAKFLVLDEPTSALDPEMTGEVLDVIEELRAEDRSLMIVSHEMGFVRHAADLVAFVANGGILEAAHSSKFFESPGLPETRKFLERVFKY